MNKKSLIRALLGSNLQIALTLIIFGLAIVASLILREANYAMLNLPENATLYELWDITLLVLYSIPPALLSVWLCRLVLKRF